MTEFTIAPWEACADLKKKVADYPLSDEGREITNLLIEWEIVQTNCLPHERKAWVRQFRAG